MHFFANFACYCVQRDALRLKPWEQEPAFVNDDDDRRGRGSDLHRIEAAIRLRNRLIKAGLSQFEPDPAGALKRRR